MEFPQYRKLSNNQSFYMIENERKFTEIQLIGTKVIVHKIEARQYPEMLRIKEMLDYTMQEIQLSSAIEVHPFLSK